MERHGPEKLEFQVLREIRRSKIGFTEGLLYSDGCLLESTGADGAPSVLHSIDLKSGAVSVVAQTPENAFGEGLALRGDTLYQLTYEDGKIFLYDAKTFRSKGALPFKVAKQGWGINPYQDGFVISDGTALLYFTNSEFAVVRKLPVRDLENRADGKINQLQVVDQVVYANLWPSDIIAKIDLNTGRVLATVDFSPLYRFFTNEELEALRQDRSVLNGIAYDPVAQSLYVTGKNWPKIFEVEITG